MQGGHKVMSLTTKPSGGYGGRINGDFLLLYIFIGLILDKPLRAKNQVRKEVHRGRVVGPKCWFHDKPKGVPGLGVSILCSPLH